ncbi:hypothetical protein BJX61DRAFT_312006 [Aspergillus egyptiacus]|nr:hypothetical protein BJX61DRAFT_312006 [Aspergillus egyptiacus]
MFFRPPIGRPSLNIRRRDQPREDQQPEVAEAQEVQDEFYPSVFDVLKVRHLLLQKVATDGLPAEVVDMIVDAAEYWPSFQCTLEEERVIRKDLDQALLCTSPLCYDKTTLDRPSPKILPHRTIHPCRKIVFSITSHDQGGLIPQRRGVGSEPAKPYDQSYTWFDAEVIHNSHDPAQRNVIEEKLNPTDRSPKHFVADDPLLLPRDNALQRNRARIWQAKGHRVVWHHLDNIDIDSPEAEETARREGRGRGTLDGKQVRGMEVGDSIIVWGRARFPGWVNYVNELSVRVFWAI